jgi:hypothetical protein
MNAKVRQVQLMPKKAFSPFRVHKPINFPTDLAAKKIIKSVRSSIFVMNTGIIQIKTSSHVHNFLSGHSDLHPYLETAPI